MRLLAADDRRQRRASLPAVPTKAKCDCVLRGPRGPSEARDGGADRGRVALTTMVTMTNSFSAMAALKSGSGPASSASTSCAFDSLSLLAAAWSRANSLEVGRRGG